MAKQEKIQLVEDIKSKLGAANGLVLANYKGMTVADLETLRRKVEGEGGACKVLKNTFLEKAFEGMNVTGMEPFLKENTILFYAKEDVMRILKPIADTAKENEKFVIKGGYMEGRAFDKEGVIAMSKMPGRKELLSMIAGNVNSVISTFVGTLNSVLTTFVGTVEALEKKKSEQ